MLWILLGAGIVVALIVLTVWSMLVVSASEDRAMEEFHRRICCERNQCGSVE